MYTKDKLLQTIVDLFALIDAIDIDNIHKLTNYRRHKLRRNLHKLFVDINALYKILLHSYPSNSQSLSLLVDEVGDQYLFKPFKVKDFAYPGYPIVYLKKRLVGSFKLIVDTLSEYGHEVKVINGIIPFVRFGAYSHRYLLLESHARGKCIDFIIKDKTASETFAILTNIFGSTDNNFLFILFPTHVHFQLNRNNQCRFVEKSSYLSCNHKFTNIFVNSSHLLSRE